MNYVTRISAESAYKASLILNKIKDRSDMFKELLEEVLIKGADNHYILDELIGLPDINGGEVTLFSIYRSAPGSNIITISSGKTISKVRGRYGHLSEKFHDTYIKVSLSSRIILGYSDPDKLFTHIAYSWLAGYSNFITSNNDTNIIELDLSRISLDEAADIVLSWKVSLSHLRVK